LELLLTGGYFRARIAGITPFDKILGGLAWAIAASNADLDIDVFSETATMGQKLKLGEGVVRSLVRMKCPYPLQTHQIKGFDMGAIFPVVQWLIKKVIETRSETGDTARAVSEYEFRKGVSAVAAAAAGVGAGMGSEAMRAQAEFAEELRERFKVQRKYKRRRGAKVSTQHTLLEYGQLKKRPEDE
jgi:hypothetical protein